VKIVLVRPGGIGDGVLCLPVAAAIRRSLPQARIIFLTSPSVAPLFQHHPDIDEILTVTGKERVRELVTLFTRAIDAAVFLMPFHKLMLAAFLARVPLRVATGYRWHSFLANRRIYEHRKGFSKHESEYNLSLLTGLGIEPGPLRRPILVLTQAEREWAHHRLRDLPNPRMLIHPGGVSPRRWRSQHYWDLACRCVKQGWGVVFTGNADERSRLLDDVPEAGEAAKWLPGVVNLMGTLTLRELMGVVASVQAVVSGSTGPAHVAAALGVPTVSLFDPRRMSAPIRWKPLGTGYILQPEVPTCEKCIYEACPYWDCLDRITVDQVVGHVKQVITRAEPLAVQRI
jgi:heptosyltransferase-2